MYQILNITTATGKSGQAYQKLSLMDVNSRQQFNASCFSPPGPIGPEFVGQIADVQLKQNGKWVNVESVTLPPPRTQVAQPTPVAPTPAPVQQVQMPPMPQVAPQPVAPAPAPMPQPIPVPEVNKKDLVYVKQTALRVAGEQVAAMVPIMASTGETPDQERIQELTEAFANNYVTYLLDTSTN